MTRRLRSPRGVVVSVDDARADQMVADGWEDLDGGAKSRKSSKSRSAAKRASSSAAADDEATADDET